MIYDLFFNQITLYCNIFFHLSYTFISYLNMNIWYLIQNEENSNRNIDMTYFISYHFISCHVLFCLFKLMTTHHYKKKSLVACLETREKESGGQSYSQERDIDILRLIESYISQLIMNKIESDRIGAHSICGNIEVFVFIFIISSFSVHHQGLISFMYDNHDAIWWWLMLSRLATHWWGLQSLAPLILLLPINFQVPDFRWRVR